MDFPSLTAEEVHAAVAKRWDLAGPLPVPHEGWLRCPICRAVRIQLRHWFWHERDLPATVRHRCDVSFKCTDCAYVWTHGVAVTPAYYTRNAHKRTVGWREGRRLLKESHGKRPAQA